MKTTRITKTVEELRNNPLELNEMLLSLFKGMETNAALAQLATTIDYVCAYAGMTSEETIDQWKYLCAMAITAQEVLGMPGVRA